MAHTPSSSTAEPLSGGATSAAIYAALCGSEDVSEAAQRAAQSLRQSSPEVGELAMLNFKWRLRTLHYLIDECGIDQIVDLGAGILVPELPHEMASGIAVAYFDSDHDAVTTSKRILRGVPNTRYALADLRDTDMVLHGARAVIDFTRPVAVIMSSVIHFVADDDDPTGVVRAYLDAIPSGSYLAISAAVRDLMPAAKIPEFRRIAARYEREIMGPAPHLRTMGEIADYFAVDGVETVPPGIVRLGDRHPDGYRGEADRTRLSEQLMVGVLCRRAVARHP